MIKVYSGTDTYESYHKAFSEAKRLAKELNTEAKIIDADELADVNTFLQQIEGVDMFNSGSMIFAKRLLQNKKLIEYIAENFDHLKTFDIVVWHEGKLDGKLKITKKLKDSASLFDSELPREGEFISWVKGEFAKAKIEISLTSIQYIAQHLGVNKWSVINEIEKIKLYLQSKNKTKISDEEVNTILGFDIKGDLWIFLDAFGARNKKKAITEFEKLTFYEDNIQLILAMLDRELRIMSQISYAKQKGLNTSILGINPYVLRKSAEKSRNFSFAELRNLTKKLFDLDFAIKKGNIEERMGLTLLLSTL